MIIVPTGILTARFGKKPLPSWFAYHRAVQCVAISAIVTAFALIFWDRRCMINWQDTHHIIGICIVPLTFVVPALGYLSNKLWYPGKKTHFWHDKVHWYVGRLLFVSATVNIVLGVYNYVSPKDVYNIWVALSVWVSGLILTFFYLEFKYGSKSEPELEHLNNHDIGRADARSSSTDTESASSERLSSSGSAAKSEDVSLIRGNSGENMEAKNWKRTIQLANIATLSSLALVCIIPCTLMCVWILNGLLK